MASVRLREAPALDPAFPAQGCVSEHTHTHRCGWIRAQRVRVSKGWTLVVPTGIVSRGLGLLSGKILKVWEVCGVLPSVYKDGKRVQVLAYVCTKWSGRQRSICSLRLSGRWEWGDTVSFWTWLYLWVVAPHSEHMCSDEN